MTFGEVPLGEAEGAILAHTLNAGALRIKKGTRLSAEDLAALERAGLSSVTVLRLEEGDVEENEAARRLAEALCGPGLEVGRPFTGRANLLAVETGVFTVDGPRIDRLNRIDEALTVATVRPYELVEAGDLAATVKVIPFAVRGPALGRAIEEARTPGALALHPLRKAAVGLLHSELAGNRPGLAAKARNVTEARLQRLGSHVGAEARCCHEADAIAAALGKLAAAACDPILVFSASAVADRGDVVPEGIVRAGGEIVHFGMPVDPGNLQLLARIGDVTVIAVPGSARSPRLHGFDWVLWRVLAGLPVGPDEITAMGVGGLLKEIAARPQPRAGQPRPGRAPRVAAIVLAAGRSTRMGERNKLLLEVAGKAMVRRAVEAALASRAAETVVVTGHEADAVRDALSGLDVRVVHNPLYSEGLSTSLREGVAALGADIDGALVMLGDMPGVRREEIDRLIAEFRPDAGGAICVSTAGGKRGNPVLWARRYFADLMKLEGDVGARHLIGEHAGDVVEVEQGEAAALDVDTPQAYRAITARTGEDT